MKRANWKANQKAREEQDISELYRLHPELTDTAHNLKLHPVKLEARRRSILKSVVRERADMLTSIALATRHLEFEQGAVSATVYLARRVQPREPAGKPTGGRWK